MDTHLVRELRATPETLRRLAAQYPDRYPFLLDSAASGPLARSTVLLAADGKSLWLDRAGRLGASGFEAHGTGFLEALEDWWVREHRNCGLSGARAPGSLEPQLPFSGGWALFLGYELAREIEPRLTLPASSFPWDAFALRTPAALIHLHDSNTTYALAEPAAVSLLDRLMADASAAANGAAEAHSRGRVPRITARCEEPAQAYLERVRAGKEYIRAGDIYQTNLARWWRVEFEEAPAAGVIYERLRAANPAPFAALAQWGGTAVLSSSPERLIRVDGREAETRPIAGTRRRRSGDREDLLAAQELVAHPKERAEHIMLIDLERNDLGRVCEAGSVRVDELMSIESYAHVHHIVSNVRGRLRAEVTPVGALRAVFPGGTITGCPKFRCMQIIAELERVGRGPYTGSLGYLTREGALDVNILIRTMTLCGRQLELRAGAGIVADSDPERELDETRAKAKGLLAALEGL